SLRSLARSRFDVNLLMILAALGAGAIGYVFEGAVLMFLFSLSNTLEVYTMGRTRHALRALLKLRPARALVRRGGREIEVEAEAVLVGEPVIVKPGEAVPVDGVVLASDFTQSLYRAMTLLVVASPCALVIATPATILSAIANAARHGILFKGGRFIEALGRVRAVAFDKTGTLTHGRFDVTDVVALT